MQVESISNEALRAAILEISSVTNMEDRITEPWFCEKETHLSLQDGGGSSKNMKRKMNATTLNDMPSPCSDIVGSEPTVTSISKKLKKLVCIISVYLFETIISAHFLFSFCLIELC